jgi:hypothetical protein
LNRSWAIVFGAGIWPSRMATLEVVSRKSGRTITLPVVIADHDGERYLAVAPGARAHIPVDRDAPVEAFEPIAADIPVFRITTLT